MLAYVYCRMTRYNCIARKLDFMDRPTSTRDGLEQCRHIFCAFGRVLNAHVRPRGHLIASMERQPNADAEPFRHLVKSFTFLARSGTLLRLAANYLSMLTDIKAKLLDDGLKIFFCFETTN